MLKPNHSLYLRVVSACVLMPVVLFLIIYGGTAFLLLMGVGLGIALKEWVRMSANFGGIHMAFGIGYILLCFASFVYLHQHYADGAGFALCLMLCVWASDSGAYFAGKAIGGPKLAPAISPNKTWAGLVGGVISSGAMHVIYAYYIGPALSRWTGQDLYILEDTPVVLLAMLGGSITLSGQAGDLIESYEKRKAGVKDSGTLIPGHGGLLDRIDALMLASPVFLLTLKILEL